MDEKKRNWDRWSIRIIFHTLDLVDKILMTLLIKKQNSWTNLWKQPVVLGSIRNFGKGWMKFCSAKCIVLKLGFGILQVFLKKIDPFVDPDSRKGLIVMVIKYAFPLLSESWNEDYRSAYDYWQERAKTSGEI